MRLRGGGNGDPGAAAPAPKIVLAELAVAAGGLIKQTIVRDRVLPHLWDKDNTILFDLQLVNAAIFE